MRRLQVPKPVACSVCAVVFVGVYFLQGSATTSQGAGTLIVRSVVAGAITLLVLGALRFWQRRQSLL
jgi:MYXO-CTERM domain-containing protein